MVVAGKDGANVQPDLPADDLNAFFVAVGPRIAGEIQAQSAAIDLNVRLPRVGACSFKLRGISFEELGHTGLACVTRQLAAPTAYAFAC